VTDKAIERAILTALKIFVKVMESHGRDNVAISIMAYDIDAPETAAGRMLVQHAANIPDDAVLRLYRGWIGAGPEPEDTVGEVVGHG
jgi:hypothetical protein